MTDLIEVFHLRGQLLGHFDAGPDRSPELDDELTGVGFGKEFGAQQRKGREARDEQHCYAADNHAT